MTFKICYQTGDNDIEHVIFIQKLKKNKINDYVKIHKDAWLDLLNATKDAGIERQMIWIKENTIYLYVIAENFDKAMVNLHKKEVYEKWM